MRLIYLLLGGLMLVAAVFVPLAKAQPPATLWTNTPITFTQFSPNPDDFLTDEVSITRGGNDVLFNDSTSPTPDTVLWAEGTIDNFGALDYETMDFYKDGDLQAVLEGNTWVMWLQNENIYIPVTFSAWGRHGVGGWTYTRGTAPAAVVLTPVKLFSPTISGGSFVFSYSNATSGLTYVVQSSSNLTSWAPVATNVAASSTVSFTNTLTTGAHYFRVQTLSGQ